MASVPVEIETLAGERDVIDWRVPEEFRTWTNDNQLYDLACSEALIDVKNKRVYYTRNLISARLLED